MAFVNIPPAPMGPHSQLKQVITAAYRNVSNGSGTDEEIHEAGSQVLAWALNLHPKRLFEKIYAASEVAIHLSEPGSDTEQQAIDLWTENVKTSPARRRAIHIMYILTNVPADTKIHQAATILSRQIRQEIRALPEVPFVRAALRRPKAVSSATSKPPLLQG